MRVVRDVIGTVIVAAIALLYIDEIAGSSVAFVSDPRGVAATGLVLGLIACAVAGESVTVSKGGAWRTTAGIIVPFVVLAGIVAVITNSSTVLGVFIALLVVIWAGSTVHHLLPTGHTTVQRTTTGHA